MNSYKTSKGERVSQGVIDRNIRKAKEIKVREFKNDHGFIFCEDCRKSSGRIDLSHTISIKYAKETGRTELCYDVNNLKFRCRNCHNILDSLRNSVRELIANEQIKINKFRDTTSGD